MLKQRVITACLLMLSFLAILFLTPWYVFAAVTACVFMVGAWEWANLAGLRTQLFRVFYALALGAAGYALYCIVFDYISKQNFYLTAAVFWCVSILWIQGYPASGLLWRPIPVRMLMGALVLIPAWVAGVDLLRQEHGPFLVLLVVLLVASADVGAYFSGRAFGRIKLSPKVSPGKSWEGVWGGLFLSVIIAYSYSFLFGSTLSAGLVLIVVPVAMISVVGDLLESMLKRERGIKDSSSILPGHGGILDRVDGLVAALPIFALLYGAIDWSL